MKNFELELCYNLDNPLWQDIPTEYHDGKRFYITPENEKYISITSILSNLGKADIQAWRSRVGERKPIRLPERRVTEEPPYILSVSDISKTKTDF